MIRRLFTLWWTVSLLLLLAACAMWVRSYWRADVVGYRWVDDARGRTHDLAGAFMSGSASVTRSWWDAPTDDAD